LFASWSSMIPSLHENIKIYKHIKINKQMQRDDLRCKKCGSMQTRVNKITRERVCNKCGHVEKVNKKIIWKENNESI